MSKDTYLGDVFDHLDAAGKAMRERLDALWVPWDHKTQSGDVYLHHAAASHLQTGIIRLAEVEALLRSVDWQDDLPRAVKKGHPIPPESEAIKQASTPTPPPPPPVELPEDRPASAPPPKPKRPRRSRAAKRAE